MHAGYFKRVYDSDRCLDLSTLKQMCSKMIGWITHRKVVCSPGCVTLCRQWVRMSFRKPLSVSVCVCQCCLQLWVSAEAVMDPVKVSPQKPLSSASAGIMCLTWLRGNSRCWEDRPGAAAHCLLWSAGQGPVFPSLCLSLPSHLWLPPSLSLFLSFSLSSPSCSYCCHCFHLLYLTLFLWALFLFPPLRFSIFRCFFFYSFFLFLSSLFLLPIS